jgi:hypothetical protein
MSARGRCTGLGGVWGLWLLGEVCCLAGAMKHTLTNVDLNTDEYNLTAHSYMQIGAVAGWFAHCDTFRRNRVVR